MVRELTKSALSFSWALSLLGLKQAVNLGRPGQPNGGDLFSPVTQMAVGQLDESMKGIYRSGDNLQSRMVDMAFSWMNPSNWFNPSSWSSIGNWANPANWANPTSWMRSATGGGQTGGGCGCPVTGMDEQAASAGSGPSAGAGPNSTSSTTNSSCGWGQPRS